MPELRPRVPNCVLTRTPAQPVAVRPLRRNRSTATWAIARLRAKICAAPLVGLRGFGQQVAESKRASRFLCEIRRGRWFRPSLRDLRASYRRSARLEGLGY